MSSYRGALVLTCLISSSLQLQLHAALQGNLSPPNIDAAFAEFVLKHGRSYTEGSKEFESRKLFFASFVQQVESHNKQPGRNWKARVNKFADRSHEEMMALRGWKGRNRPEHSSGSDDVPSTAGLLHKNASVTQLPEEHSWMNLTSIKEVRDQGTCGSCWAFAATTVLRAHSEIWMGIPRKFSVQQIISCTANPDECGGTGGCQGATAELAMDYVFKHGCRTETEMPYIETDDNCPHSLLQEGGIDEPSKKGLASASLGMLGWTKLPENKLDPLKLALVSKGPVAVSISAGYSWNQYDGGVLDDCPRDAVIDHAVVLVGFGKAKVAKDSSDGGHKELKFWHLVNSWGTDWGEAGYLRMLRNEESLKNSEKCGWDNDPQIGSGCKGGPSEVYVCGMCGLLYDTVIPHFADKRSSGSSSSVRQKTSGSFLQRK